MPTFLTDATFSFADITSTFTVIADGVKSVLSMCMQPPLSIFLGASIFGIGIGVYRALRH